MCNWRKPILCLLLFFFFSFDIILLRFWATPAKALHFLHLRAWATSCRALQKTSLFWICCKNSPLFSNLLWKLLSCEFPVRNFSLLDLLERTSSLLWIPLWELLLSSGFCFRNCFSFGEASTNITYLSSAKSFLSKHVCMLHTSSLQASSFKSSRSFGSDDIPDNFASSSSSLHQKLSQSPLLSRFRSKQNNKTPTQSPVATNNVHCTWTRRSLSLSLSLSSRVPLSLYFSLSQIARELIAEVVQEDVEKSVDKRNEFPSTLFSQIAEKDDRRSCTRRRPGVRQQEKQGFPNLFTTAIVVVRERERALYSLFPFGGSRRASNSSSEEGTGENAETSSRRCNNSNN